MLEAAEDLDLEGDADGIVASDDKLATIGQLILDQLTLEGEVAELDARLKDAKKRLGLIQEVKLPELMETARTALHRTTDGVTVEVKEDLKMEIPKKNKAQCADWLRKHDLADLVSNTVTVTLAKGQDNVVAQLTEFLDKEGFSYARAEDANTTSVKAAMKRRIEAGQEVDLALFGGHRVKKAVITLPKA